MSVAYLDYAAARGAPNGSLRRQSFDTPHAVQSARALRSRQPTINVVEFGAERKRIVTPGLAGPRCGFMNRNRGAPALHTRRVAADVDCRRKRVSHRTTGAHSSHS